MNFFFLVCNKCENCTEKDVLLNYNKKNSKNSLINKKVEIPKDEIISNDDSTNNLEIIDYPYAINFNQDFISNLNHNNYNLKQQSNYYINKVNKIKNLPTDQLDNSNIKSNSKKNSLSSSSLIINNEDNFLQNKVLLTNYYENYENIKKKEIQKKRIPYKKITNDKNNNLCNKSGRTNKKVGEKREVIAKRVAESFSAKKNNKSNSQILNMKNNNKGFRIMKTELGDYHKVKKSKTNFIMRNRSNKTRKNIIFKKKNNLIKERFLKQNIHITYNKNNNSNKNPLSKLKKNNKEALNAKQNYSKYEKSLNKFDKKNLLFYPKVKCNDSSNNNSHSLANKMSFNNHRNTNITNATNYTGSKTNNLNFSYLWLYNKDNHYLSKSYINPFEKYENKKLKNIHNLNIVTS